MTIKEIEEYVKEDNIDIYKFDIMSEEEYKHTTLDINQVMWWIRHLCNCRIEEYINYNDYDEAKEVEEARDKALYIISNSK